MSRKTQVPHRQATQGALKRLFLSATVLFGFSLPAAFGQGQTREITLTSGAFYLSVNESRNIELGYRSGYIERINVVAETADYRQVKYSLYINDKKRATTTIQGEDTTTFSDINEVVSQITIKRECKQGADCDYLKIVRVTAVVSDPPCHNHQHVRVDCDCESPCDTDCDLDCEPNRREVELDNARFSNPIQAAAYRLVAQLDRFEHGVVSHDEKTLYTVKIRKLANKLQFQAAGAGPFAGLDDETQLTVRELICAMKNAEDFFLEKSTIEDDNVGQLGNKINAIRVAFERAVGPN